MRHFTFLGLIAGLLLANDGRGIRPRSDSTDYPAHNGNRALTVGAALVPPDQVKRLFATDLDRGGYVVIEIAVFPGAGKEIDCSSRDFTLRAGSETFHAASPDAVSSALHRQNAPQPRNGKDIDIYPSATIGYESGGYDPVTGRRRSGIYTATGVGVGVGGAGGPSYPRPASTDRDQQTMRQELEDKALPEGRTTQAVAGYLYFPAPAKKMKGGPLEVTFFGADGSVRLPLSRKP